MLRDKIAMFILWTFIAAAVLGAILVSVGAISS